MSAAVPAHGWWRKLALGVAALVPFAALLAYLAATTARPPLAADAPPAADMPPVAASAAPSAPAGHTPADFDRMVADLRAELARTPQNVDGWVLLGRTLASGRRWDAAADAFRQAIAVRPGDPDLHLQLGEVLTLGADGTVTPAAAREFATAPDDPRARYYGAVATAQAGDRDTARRQLQALAADAPPDAAWLALVRTELATLTPPPAPPPDRAPIQHLQARVASNPDDAEAWLALARAMQAAGDRGHALEILTEANQRIAGNLDLLLADGALMAEGMRDDQLPPAFVALMQRVAAIDPDQPDALWYLGLAAAAAGDTTGASRRWHRLAGLLPPGSDERDAVEKRMRLLP